MEDKYLYKMRRIPKDSAVWEEIKRILDGSPAVGFEQSTEKKEAKNGDK